MQLSKKQITFFRNFCTHFWNRNQCFNILKQKMTLIACVFLKSQTTKDLVKPISKKHRFITPLYSQHVKGSQTLVKSAWQHFYYIFSSLWGKLINILKTKMTLIAYVFPKLQTANNLFRPLSKKCSFRTTFDSQHVKGSQTLVKSA